MKIIVPTTITEAMIVSASVSEPDTVLGETEWSDTEIVAEGDERFVGAPQSTVSISSGSPAVFTWVGNGLAVDTPLALTNSGGSLPGGFSEDVIIFVRQRLTDDTFTVSARKGGRPISATSAGSGTHTATAYVHRVYGALATAGTRATVTFDTTADTVGDTAHGLADGTQVVYTTTGELPTGISVGTPYFIVNGTTNGYQLALTSGGSAINLSGSPSGTHTRGLAAGYNKPPAINSDVWEHVGSTNKYAAFDQQGGTVTTADDELVFVLTPGRFNAFFVRQLDAASISVRVDLPGSPTETVYEYSLDLTNGVAVGNWYDYFYSPTYQQDTASDTDIVDAALFDLPAFADCIVTITITRTGGQVQVGTIILGLATDLGEAGDEASVEIIDNSTKDTDSRGNTTLEEGTYRDRMEVTVQIDKDDFDNVKKIMTTYRAAAIVWLAAPGVYDSMSLYGFTRRWQLRKPTNDPDHAYLSVDIESL